ncbi:MAG: hypothetical protein LWX07_10075, partial [Bacteroidetes bacterium]|nr:hypothetical protein [Bacteroidota bacterium]
KFVNVINYLTTNPATNKANKANKMTKKLTSNLDNSFLFVSAFIITIFLSIRCFYIHLINIGAKTEMWFFAQK